MSNPAKPSSHPIPTPVPDSIQSLGSALTSARDQALSQAANRVAATKNDASVEVQDGHAVVHHTDEGGQRRQTQVHLSGQVIVP